MIRAYNEKYLSDSTRIFGEMIDYAVNDCNIDSDKFMHMFIVSGIAKQFERGNLRYVTGRSGIEIASEIIYKMTGNSPCMTTTLCEDKTPEYWAGWTLAQYQWRTAKSFDDIVRYLPLSNIIKRFPALHEADITKFYSVIGGILLSANPDTNLKRIRTTANITQEKLARESNVSLRSIQMYEQRNKDINKAQGITLAKLARVLGCDIEDLLE